MEERLKELGDPSGKQTSEFWNEWFQVVCGEDHRPFEWYCGVDEVIRVLRGSNSSISNNDKQPRMIHPGSGNSLVPVKLRDDAAEFSHYKHTVVDIADVALREMKTIHDQHSTSAKKDGNEIEYLLGNILEPPLPLDDSSFDVWVDKGLVDALFKDASEPCCTQSQALFSEAYRLLRDDGSSVLVVITMAEKHSMQLILDSFWVELGTAKASLHVWELEPVSGDMRPFAFVLQRHATERAAPVYWYKNDGEVEEVIIPERTLETLLEEVGSRCDESRAHFRRGMKQKQSQDRSLATLEIKPYDAETDMEKLKEIIVTMSWTAGDERSIKVDWRMDESKVVPIGYGVSKLVLQCIVDTEDLNNLADAIGEWEGDIIIPSGVQSVDIDWEQTHMIAAPLSFPKTK